MGMSALMVADATIPTWFGVGGCARRFARPLSAADLATLLSVERELRVLGDGANLLVDDDGVDELVVCLTDPKSEFVRVEMGEATSEGTIVRAGAGVHLFKLMNQTVRAGLEGLEVLAGVPATLGGAIVMNAGGAYGQIADVVRRVHAITREGERLTLERSDIAFSYRHSGLGHLIVTGAELLLRPGEVAALEQRKKAINDAKLASQPMSAHSAGCCFKNPTLREDLSIAGQHVGRTGQRVSAGLLIDRAGCKGLRFRTASVSTQHANFLTIDDKHAGKARDVIALMAMVQRKVFDAFGVGLEREVVVWGRPDVLAGLLPDGTHG